MEVTETVKLPPKQLALLFSLALPLAAFPVLYIFLVDPALFEKLETSKLLLLAFSAAAPVFGVFYSTSLLKFMIEVPKEDGRSKDEFILSSLYTASVITAIFWGLFAISIAMNSRFAMDLTRKAMIMPMAFGVVVGYAFLGTTLYSATRRRKVNKAPEPTLVAQHQTLGTNMPKPDYTLSFVTDREGQLFIHADYDGLAALIDSLNNLKKKLAIGVSDHDHLMTEAWAGSELSEGKGKEEGSTIHHVKIYGWTREKMFEHGLRGEPQA